MKGNGSAPLKDSYGEDRAMESGEQIDENGENTIDPREDPILNIGLDRHNSSNDSKDQDETSSSRSEPILSVSNPPSHLVSLSAQHLDPDRPEKLLLFKGKLNGHKCTILIDGGANNNFVSETFRRKTNLPTVATTTPTSVSMGDVFPNGMDPEGFPDFPAPPPPPFRRPLLTRHRGEDYVDTAGVNQQRSHRLPSGTRSHPQR
eukprot:gene7608-762_t